MVVWLELLELLKIIKYIQYDIEITTGLTIVVHPYHMVVCSGHINIMHCNTREIARHHL